MLMTHLFLVKGVVCTGTDVLADVTVVVIAVGDVVVVVALLVTLFSHTMVLWGCPPKNLCLPKVLKF